MSSSMIGAQVQSEKRTAVSTQDFMAVVLVGNGEK